MHPSILAAALCGLFAAITNAQVVATPPSAEATIRQLESELAQLQQQILKRYEAATPEQRKALPDVNLWPREQVMPKIARAADLFAGTPEAAALHLWIVDDSRRLVDPSLALKSVDRLLADHMEDERLENLAAWLPRYARFFGVEGTLARLERLRKGAPKLRVQAACMLSHALTAPSSQEVLKDRLREVMEFAPDSGSSKRAKGRLFEIEHLQVGCEAPEILGTTLAGMPFKLSDYRGKVVVLEFWTIGCGPCRQKAPKTAARLQHYAGQPFAHIGVHTADNSIQAIRETANELGITWPVVLDTPKAGTTMGPIATLWQVAGWPTVYVIDHEGIIRSNWARELEMKELVPALLEKVRKQ